MKILQQIREARMDEEVIVAEAASGMRVAVARKPGYSTAAGYFGLRFGSNDVRFRSPEGGEVQVPEGSAHYLEHKLFEGREEKVFDRFGKLGADFNGGTGFSSTSYYFVSSGAFAPCLEVLLDFVQHPMITEERVDKERGIIEQEVRMYEDAPEWRGHFLLHRALYHQHPIRVSPGGPVSEVRRTTAAHLRACFDAFYRPHRMCLALAGDFDPQQVLDWVEQWADPARPGQPLSLAPEEPATPATDWLEEEFAVSRPHVWLGWREGGGPGLGRPLLQQRVLSGLAMDLLFEDSSVVHEALYREGVIDDSFGAHSSYDHDWGYVSVQGLSDDPERFAARLREEAARFAAEGPLAADFERVRRAAWGATVSGCQTPASLAGSVLHSLLAEVEPFEYLDVLAGVRREDVAEWAARVLDPAQSAVAVLRPPK